MLTAVISAAGAIGVDIEDKSTCKHCGYPHGKHQTCTMPKSVLSNLFCVLAEQSEKGAPLRSSQSNESFHNIATRPPKPGTMEGVILKTSAWLQLHCKPMKATRT